MDKFDNKKAGGGRGPFRFHCLSDRNHSGYLRREIDARRTKGRFRRTFKRIYASSRLVINLIDQRLGCQEKTGERQNLGNVPTTSKYLPAPAI